MSQQFKILLVEDVATDAELMLRELERTGIRCDARRVETAVDYRRELEEFQPHVILSDFSMPRIDGMEALRIARQSYPHIPFIFVSGALGEEYAVRALKSGATDFVLKDNLLRLPPSVERAIKEAVERRARQALEHQLRESEKRYRELFQSNPHPMWVYDIETLRFLAVNDTAITRYGFSREEFLAMTIKDIRPEKHLPRLLDHVAKVLPRVNEPESWQHWTKSAELIDVEIASHDLVWGDRPARIVVAYDITKRKRAEEALRKSESRLRAIIDTEPECVKVIAGDGMLLEMNQAGLAMLQADSLVEAQQQSLLEFIVPEHRAAFENLHNRVMNGESGMLEFEVIGLKGARCWLETSAAPLRNAAGEVQQLLGITRDITEQRNAREQLRESEERLRAFMEYSPTVMFMKDLQGRYQDINAQFLRRFDLSRDEVLGRTDFELFQTEQASVFVANDVKVATEGIPIEIEETARYADGAHISIVGKFPIRNASGEIVAIGGVATDITDRKRSEEALREYQIQLAEGQAIANFGSWRWDLRSGALRWSKQLLQIYGITEAEFSPNLDGYLSRVHPEDRGKSQNVIERALAGGNPFEYEERILRPDGSVRLLASRGRVERDAEGRPIWLYGICQDVTERKRAEQRLLDSEAKYRQLIEQAADGMVISNAGGNLLLANSRACELLGYTEDEFLGLNGKVTYLEEEREDYTKRMELVRTGGVLRFERMVKRKDGSAFPAEVSLKMLDSGVVQVIFHDITTRRGQERKMARLSRIHAVLSGINSAIVRIRDRQELFQEACRILVEYGGFTVGWISVLDRASGKLLPVAKAGLPLDLDAGSDSSDRPVGVVPAGSSEVALREKRPAFDNDIEQAPDVTSVRRAAIRAGAMSVIALPLIVQDEAFGILALYAPERNFFDDEEIKLLTELAGDISFGLEFIAKEEKVDYLAYYDALTGLPNRSLFSERLSQHLHTRAESPELVAVVLMDVEHFRMVNDTLGRQTGDKVLRLIAGRLESSATLTRCSNPARAAADAFAVIIRGAHDVNELAHLLEEGMKATFGVPFVIDGKEVRLIARAGVSAYPTDGSTAESLLHNAEAALRKAKQANERFVFYAPEMNARVAEFLVLETKLRKAIELEQFVLHYQPKLDVATGKITGVEALIRWSDPDTGLVPPLQFIQVLEETGMIFEVGRWALRQALADQQRWRSKGLPVPRVAVNVSARQLRDPHFVQDVQLALASQEGLMPELELEITESLLMENIERNVERLKTLRGLGVTVAIDDFGTGYSSLNYLARLPMDTLKIDRSFVAGMSASTENRTIVSTIISLAHSLGVKVVAEGVETEDQLNLLRRLKCDEIQGFLVSRPVASDEFSSSLSR